MSSVEPLSSVWIPRADWEGLSRWVVRMEWYYDTLRTPSSETWAVFVHEGKAALSRWAQSGRFLRIQGPGVALLRQHFTERGEMRERWGVWCRFRLNAPTIPVYEHEHTFSDGVEAYMSIYRRLGVFPDPVHLLTSTSIRRWRPLIEELTQHPPLLAMEDAMGDTFALWWEQRPEKVQAWLSLLDPPYVIADGHHRMAAARALARQGVLNARPVVITALDDPGLVIRPFHRVLQGGPVWPVPRRLESLFSWRLQDGVPQAPGRGSLLWVTPGRIHRVFPTGEDRLRTQWGASVPTDYTRLETAWLHEILLPAYQEEGRPLDVVQYAVSAEDAVRAVEDRRASLSVLLPAPEPEQVFAIAREGKILPQKSTAFYPKLLAGLIAVPLELYRRADQAAVLR